MTHAILERERGSDCPSQFFGGWSSDKGVFPLLDVEVGFIGVRARHVVQESWKGQLGILQNQRARVP
jgi:hypothetical protein